MTLDYVELAQGLLKEAGHPRLAEFVELNTKKSARFNPVVLDYKKVRPLTLWEVNAFLQMTHITHQVLCRTLPVCPLRAIDEEYYQDNDCRTTNEDRFHAPACDFDDVLDAWYVFNQPDKKGTQ